MRYRRFGLFGAGFWGGDWGLVYRGSATGVVGVRMTISAGMKTLRHILKWRPTRLDHVGVALLALLIGWIVLSQFMYERVIQPKSTTLTEFIQVMPVSNVKTSGGTRGSMTVVKCGVPWWLLAFPDDLPSYYFDESGKLVSWKSGS